jgi:hypothetical protein
MRPSANRINAPRANQRQQTHAPPTLLRSAAFMRSATSSLERQRAAAVGAMSLDPRLGALLRAVREATCCVEAEPSEPTTRMESSCTNSGQSFTE